METQVRTPQSVFMLPQRLVVPLFQRPYVWNEENQWEPLWDDVARLADRTLKEPGRRHQPHFLGAVVLQQVPRPIGLMQERTIIDGQQRLTTLQVLLDALHAELSILNAVQPAARLEGLVANAEAYCARPEDRFKVWPTNKDRGAFNSVMGAQPPIDYARLDGAARLVQAHRFFAEEARSWLQSHGPEEVPRRAAAIETAVREHLQLVVIDLGVDENAQEIFETLNARGAQLTAADLIKNFVFQRLLEDGANVEEAYERFWKEFETGFWETEINVGRVRYPRSSIFLNHWLVVRCGEEVVAREVFERFKRYADLDSDLSMLELLRRVKAAAAVYRAFVESAASKTGPLDRVGLFGYRTGTMESEAVKPLVMCLLDPADAPIPEVQVRKALQAVESWMVRRMLVRATTKAYNKIVADLVPLIQGAGRAKAGDVVEQFLAGQTSDSSYWPDDAEIRDQLGGLLAYRRLGRSRLRMVLEAIEDRLRGWKGDETGFAEERVARGKLAIEHVMPRKWTEHWPLGEESAEDRDQLIHTLGNLTLLTNRLNARVSNGPWGGESGKKQGLETHSVLLLSRGIVNDPSPWSAERIRQRTKSLTESILEIWPVPDGHRSNFARVRPRKRRRVTLLDLIGAGKVHAGATLYARGKKHSTRTATLLADGRIDLDGRAFDGPSPAASEIAGHAVNGWWFFLVDQAARVSLSHLRRDYLGMTEAGGGVEDEEADDDLDDEE